MARFQWSFLFGGFPSPGPRCARCHFFRIVPVLWGMVCSFAFAAHCPLAGIYIRFRWYLGSARGTVTAIRHSQAPLPHTWVLSVAPWMVSPLGFSPLPHPSYTPRLILLKYCFHLTQKPLEATPMAYRIKTRPPSQLSLPAASFLLTFRPSYSNSLFSWHPSRALSSPPLHLRLLSLTVAFDS